MKFSNQDVIRSRLSLSKRIEKLLKKGRAVCLHGKTGVGKTTLATAILETLGYMVIRVNGSLVLSEATVPAVQNAMDNTKIALLVDEMDRSLVGNYKLLLKLLFYNEYKVDKKTNKRVVSNRKTRVPLMFCCNYIKKFKFKEEFCERIEVKALSSKTIQNILEKIDAGVPHSRILKLVADCKGDIRAALNNLESGEIHKEDEFNLYKFVQRFFILDAEEKYNLLDSVHVGEYGSPVYLPWFVSLLSRNIKGDLDSQVCDHALLAAASEAIHEVPVEMTKMLLSCLSTNKIFKIKFPPKKKKENDEE